RPRALHGARRPADAGPSRPAAPARGRPDEVPLLRPRHRSAPRGCGGSRAGSRLARRSSRRPRQPPGAAIVSALAGPPKPSFLARIRAGELGGVILVGSWRPAEFVQTTRTLHAAGCAAGRPLLVLVDQEGGFARRLTWAAPWHSEGQL